MSFYSIKIQVEIFYTNQTYRQSQLFLRSVSPQLGLPCPVTTDTKDLILRVKSYGKWLIRFRK